MASAPPPDPAPVSDVAVGLVPLEEYRAKERPARYAIKASGRG
jgi:hypothetical protein